MKRVGSLMESLQGGKTIPLRHANPYLLQVPRLRGILLSPSEVESGALCPAGTGRIVEVGCYFGKTLQELAQGNPQASVLGLEVTYKRAVRSAARLEAHGLSHAQVAVMDVLSFLGLCDDGSLAGLVVFFPDPWPKARQAKHRVLGAQFFLQARRCLRPGGFVWVKTDHPGTFADVQGFAAESGMVQGEKQFPQGLAPSSYVSQFELLFRGKRQQIFQGVWTHGFQG